MTTDHVEIEDKFDLDEAAELPDFRRLPGVRSVSPAVHELVATYFDTRDLALADAGVTLRRRVGGDDAGWHLKLQRDGDRREVRVPLARAVRTPPLALRRVVAGIVRDQSLQPVVTIRTDRRVQCLEDKKGRVLAEVADDRVSAEPATTDAPGLSPLTWREAEVELGSGSRALLDAASALLVAVGARPSSSPSKLARALGDRLPVLEPPALPTPRKKGPAADVVRLRLVGQVALLRRLDPWVRHDAPEAVHDMRVTVRRLRNALASYRPLVETEQSEPLRDELGWLAALLGGPRDSEVLHEMLAHMIDDLPADLVRGPVRARVRRELRARYVDSRAELMAAMTSDRYFELVDRLVGFAAEPPWTAAAHQQTRRVLPERLDHDWKRLRTRVRAANDRDGVGGRAAAAADLHVVRKAAKRVRYAAEALVPLYGEAAARTVEANERIQTLLGDFHDAVVAQELLVELGDHAAAQGENAFTYGELHARAEYAGAGQLATFDEAWRASRAIRAEHRLD